MLTGQLYYDEIHGHENDARFLDVTRFPNVETFYLFADTHGEVGLEDGLFIYAGQKFMVFIHAIHGATYREIKDRWQHSMSTINDIVYEVSVAIIKIESTLFFSIEFTYYLIPSLLLKSCSFDTLIF